MMVMNASPARKVNGQFAKPSAGDAITTVLLPNWTLGYRVGPNGRIYANEADARRFAAYREARAKQAN